MAKEADIRCLGRNTVAVRVLNFNASKCKNLSGLVYRMLQRSIENDGPDQSLIDSGSAP
jgi:hypothetical protein